MGRSSDPVKQLFIFGKLSAEVTRREEVKRATETELPILRPGLRIRV